MKLYRLEIKDIRSKAWFYGKMENHTIIGPHPDLEGFVRAKKN